MNLVEILKLKNTLALEAAANNVRPVLLLDIDGVVSSLGRITGHIRRARHVQDAKWMVTEQVAESLSLLSAEVDVSWASSWAHESLELAEELGIASVGFLDFSRFRTPARAWFKTEALIEYLESNTHRQVIYAEDEAPAEVISELHRVHGNVLTVEVDGDIGLTPEHFEIMREFIS